jgi:formate C-acetyltransferase
MSTAADRSRTAATTEPWRQFIPGPWMHRIDVRDFILLNVKPYEGEESFLAGPTERTKAVWATLQPYFREEAKKGVLDVDPATPSTMTSHAPGYIGPTR